MKKPLYLFLVFTLLSCSGPKDSFERYYYQEVKNAKLAFSFPRWLPMIFIPKESKEEVKYFTEGMKRVKMLIYDTKQKDSSQSFRDFAKEKDFEKYLEVRNGKEQVTVLSKETDLQFKEIVLEFVSDEEHVIIALLGSIDKQRFYEAIKKMKEEADI